MERPSFLDKVKAKFGANKQGPNSVKNESKGRQTYSVASSRSGSKRSENRLTGNGGDGINDDGVDQGISHISDVYFHETDMGMTMQEEKQTGRLIVNNVIHGLEGQRLGVKVGDVLVMIEKNPISSVEAFSQAARDFPRPLCLTFERNLNNKGGGVRSTRKGGVPGAIDAIKEHCFPSAGLQKSTSLTRSDAANPPQPLITEDEKIQRRQAALMAAEGRSKGWERRVQRNRQGAGVERSSARSDSRNSGPETSGASPPEFASKSVNPQTIASVKQAKQQEAETAKQMGYNPYTPQMIGLAQARNAAITGGGDTGIGSVSPSPYPVNQSPESQPPQILPETAAASSTNTDQWETWEHEIVEEVEPLVAQVILSGPERASVALSTVLSMLNNVALKNDVKYHRIRLSNPGFQKKVACVPGAIDILEVAGFELRTEEGELILQYSEAHDGNSIPPKLKAAINAISRAHVT